MKIDRQYSRFQGWSLEERDPQVIQEWMPIFEWFYLYYFRVKTSGWHHIPPQDKILFVGSHNGGLAAPDMVMTMYDWFRHFGPERPVYGLAHSHIWKVFPKLAKIAVKMGAIVAHPQMAIAAFRSGASVLVYPGGGQDAFRPHCQRHKINLAGRKGFIKLAIRENVPIIPVISWGAHDTLIVLADVYSQAKQLHQWGMPWLFNLDPQVFPIYLGLPWGLGIGPLPNFPLPMQIHTRICAPIIFERYGKEAAGDRPYIEACYDRVHTQMQQALDRLIAKSQTNSS